MIRLGRPQDLISTFCSICTRFTRTVVTQPNIMSENKVIDTNQQEKRPLEEETEHDAKKIKTDTFVRIKKRNFAMMLGYLGKNYFGMQRNPGMATIEEELISAMLKAKLINSGDFETIQNINFQRAARTDKGVSAVRQTVSLKLPENPCKDTLNTYLPDDIRVFAIKRVTKGFNSKSQCDARTYSYTIPTFAFADENMEEFAETAEFVDVDKRMEQLSTIDGKPYHEYRLPKEKLEELREMLKLYEGTHNFHNFTSKVLPLDPRAKRFIMSFTTEDPFVVDNMEFITLKVKGQSFMLHQIRKMVAMSIGLLRKHINREIFDQAFERRKYDISRAPSLGLMLNIVHYDYYNKKYGSDGVHEKLDWLECEEEIREFEKTKILKDVFDTEIKEKATLNWLANLNVNSFGPRDEAKWAARDEARAKAEAEAKTETEAKAEAEPEAQAAVEKDDK
ncbi:tRNA pseudouridine synthase A [Trichogramma pretiosum]|uniref:tRNA pseudouridine synthase A n=1 Tax=Trichogramma pretiosum TaxID=7493 RepID=UPI0006C93F50|nr:tRNA pseudouridine synthase A [Trichogramma pretiosum]